MAESLRILILEDSAVDAELIQFELREAGLAFSAGVVSSEEDYFRELEDNPPDLILSDYGLPRYSGALALVEAKKRHPDIPFILVTGAISEERAIDMLTGGARDYVMKSRLAQRLVPAVRRALEEAEEHRARKKAEEELREAHRTLEEKVKIRTAELEAEMAARKNTEAALLVAVERLELAQGAANIGIWDWSVATDRIEWSPQMFVLFGLDPQSNTASFETWRSILHPEDLQMAESRIDQSLKRQTFLSSDYRIVLPDGRIRWINSVGQGGYDHHGRPVRMAGICMDITERKQIEEALRESSRRFTLLSSTAGRLLGSDDPQAIIENLCRDVMVYLDCQTFFNFLVDEHAGRLHLNACAGISEEEARDIAWLDYGVAVCGCVAQEGHRIVAEDILHTPDDRTELIKSYGIQAYCCHPLIVRDHLIGTLSFGTRTRPHFTPDEVELMRMVADYVAVAMMRKQTEQSLQETNDLLEQRVKERTRELKAASLYARRLIETNLDPLVTISTDGKIMDVNIATEVATGLPRSELLGTDFSEYFTEPEKARAGYEQAFREGEVRDYPLTIRHRSGGTTEVLYNASVYLNGHGEIEGVFAAARDVTELRQAQNDLLKSYEELERRVEERTADLQEKTELLEAANKELESFSYSVSHDLKAPLWAINGFSRMLLKKYGDKIDAEATRKLNVIRDSAQMMNQLIDDLLSFSRFSRQEMRKARIDMKAMTASVWEDVRLQNQERWMDISIGDMQSAYGDSTLIRQVLANLLSNAVKFTKEQRPAVIRTSSSFENGEVVYCVRDNGVGFDMTHYDKLFGVFQRLHSADEYEGTGVGLAIVQRIIHRHGGRIWAEGKEGEGAAFYFTLPQAAGDD